MGDIFWEHFRSFSNPTTHPVHATFIFLSSLSVCAFVSSRGQTGEGEWAEHSGENLLSGYSTHPKQVGDLFIFIFFTSH